MTEPPDDILPIAALSRGDPSRYGGKAVTLGVLSLHHFDVPSGIALPSSLTALLAEKSDAEILSLLQRHIKNDGLYAVRSSAPVEDGRAHALAGLFSSFLDVGFRDLPEHIRACVRSATSERVRAYATRLNVEFRGGMPIIIQHMLRPDRAGVAFSRHPLYPQKNIAIVEAVRGTAEKLVSGTETPERYVIDRVTKTVIETDGDAEILKDDALRSIVDACERIESLLGFPVDVEWAMENDTLFILQARPITGTRY